MSGPYIQPIGQSEASQQQDPDLRNDLIFRNGARGDGSIGLIDSINVSIVPIINGLGISCEEGSCQNHGRKSLGSIFETQKDIPIILIKGVPYPVIVSGCGRPTHDTPHKWNPRDRFGQLKTDLP